MIRIITISVLSLILINTLPACIIFNYTQNGKTMVGNNEDWADPKTKMWFVTGTEDQYGRIYFGFSNLEPQGGMNEMGLVFDACATPTLEVRNSQGKPIFNGDLIDKVMAECATVKEAQSMLSQYDLSFFRNFQIMLVDKLGNSTIIEGDTSINKLGDFQICTNFYQSQLQKEDDIPCDRYNIAFTMLSNQGYSLDLFREILSATHQEGRYPTQYSTIYDLNNGIVFLYHFHNYEKLMRINLKEALKLGDHVIDIPEEFPDNFAFQQYLENRKKPVSEILLKIIEKNNIEVALEEYGKIKNQYKREYEFDISEHILNELGYELLNRNDLKAAVEIFKLNTREYPDSWNVYDSLAESFWRSGFIPEAIENYEKSLELNPENSNAKSSLKELYFIVDN